jgi:hypothetical protein
MRPALRIAPDEESDGLSGEVRGDRVVRFLISSHKPRQTVEVSMSHRPYPNAERALRQLSRHYNAPSEPVVKWAQPPSGWGAAVGAQIAAPFQAFAESARAVTPPKLPYLQVAPGRAVLPGGISVEVRDGVMTIEEAVERSLVTITNRLA